MRLAFPQAKTCSTEQFGEKSAACGQTHKLAVIARFNSVGPGVRRIDIHVQQVVGKCKLLKPGLTS